MSETISFRRAGNNLRGTVVFQDGETSVSKSFEGKLMPPLPSPPDLSHDLSGVKFGPRIEQFNGKNLTGWRVTDKTKING